MAAYGPDWLAYDMRLMMQGIQHRGMHAEEGTVAALEQLLGRPLRSYRELVRERVASRP